MSVCKWVSELVWVWAPCVFALGFRIYRNEIVFRWLASDLCEKKTHSQLALSSHSRYPSRTYYSSWPNSINGILCVPLRYGNFVCLLRLLPICCEWIRKYICMRALPFHWAIPNRRNRSKELKIFFFIFFFVIFIWNRVEHKHALSPRRLTNWFYAARAHSPCETQCYAASMRQRCFGWAAASIAVIIIVRDSNSKAIQMMWVVYAFHSTVTFTLGSGR